MFLELKNYNNQITNEKSLHFGLCVCVCGCSMIQFGHSLNSDIMHVICGKPTCVFALKDFKIL